MADSIISDAVVVDIASIAAGRAAQYGSTGETPGDFVPSPELLRTVIDTAFWASLAFEEGRPALCKLVFSEQVDQACRFAQPLPLSPDQLRMLSPLAETPGLLLQVSRSGTIDGVLAGTSGAASIHATGPGRVAIGLWPYVLYVFEQGEWITVKASVNDLIGTLRAAFVGADSAGRLMRSIVLLDLIRNARQSRRGAIILVADPQSFRGVEQPSSLQVSRFLQFADLEIDWHAEMPAAEQLSRARQQEWTRSMYREVFGAGAGIDGATILDPDLAIVSFGAKIEVDLEQDFEVQRTVLPSTRPETITRSKVGGMRHQSAACFARLNPGSTAITISQDGFISIFATAAGNPGPDQPERPVVMLTGIERYYETEWSLRVR